MALSPSAVMGIFTTILGWMAAISRPSAIIPSASTVVAFTSPLMGPSTMEAIWEITSLKSLPSFAIREGLVVTPQIMPISAACRISSTLAVSIKNFITPVLSPVYATGRVASLSHSFSSPSR